jgi:hypothetical protein
MQAADAPPPTMSTVLVYLQQISHFARLCYSELQASPSTYLPGCHDNHGDHSDFANAVARKELENSRLIRELEEHKSSLGSVVELLNIQEGELKKMRDAVQDAADRNAELVQARDKELNEHKIATEAILEILDSSDQKVAELEGRVQELVAEQKPQCSRPRSSRKRKQPTRLGLEYEPWDSNGAEPKRVRAG